MALTIRRRDTLAGMAAFALPLEAQPESLSAIAARRGLRFGTALSAGKPFDDPRHLAIVARECALIVPENELKLYVIGGGDAPNFAPADRIARFANDRKIALRGHTLLWNNARYIPKALPGLGEAPDAATAERWLRAYIARVTQRYGTQIGSWDVVNETIDPDTGAIRDTIFTRALGFDALRIAYEAVREHAPHAQRVYNDYMSWEAGNATHRRGVLTLLERFRRERVPVDALGIQSHIGTQGRPDAAGKREWQTFVDAVVAMGYDLLITEFDVNDRGLGGDIAKRDAEVAALAKDYLDRMLSYPRLRDVLSWGMVDRYTWLNGFAPRSDGMPQRPLPYDAEYRPKLLRTAIAQALAAAPSR